MASMGDSNGRVFLLRCCHLVLNGTKMVAFSFDEIYAGLVKVVVEVV